MAGQLFLLIIELENNQFYKSTKLSLRKTSNKLWLRLRFLLSFQINIKRSVHHCQPIIDMLFTYLFRKKSLPDSGFILGSDLNPPPPYHPIPSPRYI